MTMDRAAILAKLAEVFEDVMDTDGVVLTEATTGDDVEEWDSLSHVRLMVSVERAFGLRFTTAEISDFETLGDIVTAIAAKQDARAA
jgi:acyl carrier protein